MILCDPRCAEVDPELWYRPDAVSVRRAKSICNRCEARDTCLQVGMAFPDEDQWGVWGGIDAAGRRALRAADPERWPVRVEPLADFLGSRGERFADSYEDGVAARDDGRRNWGESRVDWAETAWEANVETLMDRYPTDTEAGYGLTGEGATVYPLNDKAAA